MICWSFWPWLSLRRGAGGGLLLRQALEFLYRRVLHRRSQVGPWFTALSAEGVRHVGLSAHGHPGLAYFFGASEAMWTCIGLAIGTYLNWLFVAKAPASVLRARARHHHPGVLLQPLP